MCIRDRYYRRALRALEQIGGSLWVMGVLNLNLGAAYVKHDERAVAFEHLERARDLFAQAKSRDLLPELHRRLAEAHQAQKELAEARREAETSLALAEELSMLGEQGLTRRTLGNIAAEDGRTDDAERDLQRAIHILTEVGDNYGRACAQLSLAEVCSHASDAARRSQLLGECIPVFDRLGAALEMARAQALLSLV